MGKKCKILVACFLLCAVPAVLFAQADAETLYQSTTSLDLENEDLAVIIESYDKLFAQIANEMKLVEKELMEAKKSGAAEAVRDAYGRLFILSSYRLTEEQTEQLLARILQKEEPDRSQYADWLYKHSSYYHPTLYLEIRVAEEDYQYSYTQRIRRPPGVEVTLPDASDIRVNSSETGILAGWGLTVDTLTYQAGETIVMPANDQTLYAIWKSGVCFTDDISQTSIVYDVEPGDEVPVPAVTAFDDSYRFAGWHDQSSRTFLKPEEATYILKGKGAVFEGCWKKIAIKGIDTLYWDSDSLPAGRRIFVTFSLANEGTVPVQGITILLQTDNPYVRLLQGTMTARYLPPQTMRRYPPFSPWHQEMRPDMCWFILDEDTPSGTVAPFTLTVTDLSGERWTSEASFTVK